MISPKITSLEIEVEAVLKRSFMRDETDNHITKLLADGKEYQYWKRMLPGFFFDI